MRMKILIYILLFITGGLYVLSKILQLSTLELYVKPTTVPLFFMLYWFNAKRIDTVFVLVLILAFLGDIFLLTDLENSFVYVLLCYGVCYLLLFYFLWKNYQPIVYNSSDIVYLMGFFVVWTFIAYEVYDATQEAMGEIKYYGLIYLLILYLLFIGAVFQYINVRSSKSLWFLVAILNFVISDSCFALDRFYVESVQFEVIYAIYQLLGVFFLVQFMISSPTPLRLSRF